MDNIKLDQVTQDRLLNDIIVSVRAAKPSRVGAGLKFSLKTLLVAAAIIMLSAMTAFAAYGAGLNAGQPPEQPNEDVEQLNELIVALQEENAELNGQVAALSEEVEDLRAKINVAQFETKEDFYWISSFSRSNYGLQWDIMKRSVFMDYTLGAAGASARFSTLNDANAAAPFTILGPGETSAWKLSLLPSIWTGLALMIL